MPLEIIAADSLERLSEMYDAWEKETLLAISQQKVYFDNQLTSRPLQLSTPQIGWHDEKQHDGSSHREFYVYVQHNYDPANNPPPVKPLITK